jgi:hypothetical protein
LHVKKNGFPGIKTNKKCAKEDYTERSSINTGIVEMRLRLLRKMKLAIPKEDWLSPSKQYGSRHLITIKIVTNLYNDSKTWN